MCGIAGIIGPRDISENMDLLRTLAISVSQRGPDDEGYEIIKFRTRESRGLGLVHRRLSILDLSESGHQPMRDLRSGNCIVYNGEIYNFHDIKKELKGAGYDFISNTDTEVILKGYGHWGYGVMEHLRGMFAFAIWDDASQKLFLARDRFGVKPLYYYKGRDGIFIFSSELRAILNTGLVPRKIDSAALESYLAYGAVQAPFTIIEGIKCLLPGHYMIIDDKGEIETTCKYWHIPFKNSGSDIGPDRLDMTDRLRNLLEETVRYHLVSDVPVGVFLSGGIDSSSIVALVKKVTSAPPMTFSITFSEKEFSEAPYSRAVAEKYKTQHTEIHLTEDRMFQLLPEAMEAMDQPTINGMNVYAISKLVRDAGLKAVLSGLGGDEVFAGYQTHKYIKAFFRYKPFFSAIPLPIRLKAAGLWETAAGRKFIGHKASDLMLKSNNTLSAYLVLKALFLPKARKALLNNSCDSRLDEGLPMDFAKDLRESSSRLGQVDQVLLFESSIYMANMLLRDGDFMSMAHGLEIRVPFLDHKLSEYVAAIPGELKVDARLPKPLLLRAMGDLLPPFIYQRAKTGFTFPWERWLRNRLQPQVSNVMNDGETWSKIGINSSFPQQLWHGFLKGAYGYTWSRSWGLFVLYKWCQRHGVTI